MKLIYEAPIIEEWPDLEHSAEWLPPKFRAENRVKENYKLLQDKQRQRPQSAKVISPTKRQQIKPTTAKISNELMITNQRTDPNIFQKYQTVESGAKNMNVMRCSQQFKNVSPKRPMFKRGWEKTPMYEEPKVPFTIRGKVPYYDLMDQDPENILYVKKIDPLPVFIDNNPPSPIQKKNDYDFKQSVMESHLVSQSQMENQQLVIQQQNFMKQEIQQLDQKIEQLEQKKKEDDQNLIKTIKPVQGNSKFGVFSLQKENPYQTIEKDVQKLQNGINNLINQVREIKYQPGETGKKLELQLKEIHELNKLKAQNQLNMKRVGAHINKKVSNSNKVQKDIIQKQIVIEQNDNKIQLDIENHQLAKQNKTQNEENLFKNKKAKPIKKQYKQSNSKAANKMLAFIDDFDMDNLE